MVKGYGRNWKEVREGKRDMARGLEEAGEWEKGKEKVGKGTERDQGDRIFFFFDNERCRKNPREIGYRFLNIPFHSLGENVLMLFLKHTIKCSFVLTLIQTKYWQCLKG